MLRFNPLSGTLDIPSDSTALNAHTSNTSNPHNVTKAQVGLGNVDNTSDANKPVSTAQAAADALKVNKAGDIMTGVLSIQTASDPSLQLINTTIAKSFKVVLGSSNFGIWNVTDGKTPFKVRISAPEAALEVLDNGLNIGGVNYLQGTGFPEGVVTAPVGSIYIDKAVTSGASSWIKKSGTGSTGWVIDKGDTGWRDITALFGGQLSTTYSPNDYGVYIRRKDEVVSINFKCAIGTGYAGAAVGIPAGFKTGGSSTNAILPFSILNLWQTAGSNTGQVQISTTFGFVTFTNITAGTRYYGSLTYLANDAYPSTLPGTAV